jgi:tetratricopeptide (TPR) repeat protein
VGDEIAQKLDRAVADVLALHEPDVKAMVLIGSVTSERTAASDLDVSVVFEDHCYEARGRDLRRGLAELATGINAAVPGPELMLWASKADHFVTLFPDVSYVRANLPASDERLDAWCGLAKHTLQHYEEATGRQLWGDVELRSSWRIPRAEAVELFVLATRTFAEGLAELHSADEHVRAAGNNHVAKGILRAAYAMLLAGGRGPHNSYAAIHEAARERLPEPLRPTLDAALQAKTRAVPLRDTTSTAAALAVMRHCEAQVASAPRWRIGGPVAKPGDEGFGFDPEALDTDRDPATYSRCPAPDENYVQFGYFVITAPVVMDRLASVPADADVADFYLDELAAVTIHAMLRRGLAVGFGVHEPELVRRSIDDATIRAVATYLEALARAYLQPGAQFDVPWLDHERKRQRVAALLLVASGAPGVEIADDLVERVQEQTGVEGVLDGVEWVCEVAGGMFSLSGLRLLSTLGLKLYQAGDVARARRILTRAAELARLDTGDGRELAVLRSQALQHLAISEHREGDLQDALAHYQEALDHDPENFSAVDDLAALLSEHFPPAVAHEILIERFGGFVEHRDDARDSIVGHVLNRAVDLKQAGDYDAAEGWYRLTLAVAPEMPMAHFNYGMLLEATGRVLEAVPEYMAALALDPGYAKARERLMMLTG